MNRILIYLKGHKLAWMLPILLFLAVLLVVAWKIARTPDDPFAYRSH
ncbi:MAG TPA: hypothetical protein VK824_02195 [Planctomycetota bacterium]|nr:hypothetical protein [Planctomycetota bacterium]